MKSIRISATFVAAMVAGWVRAGGTVTPSGTELVFDVPQGETFTYTSLIDNTYETLRKTGAGTLDLAGANNSFTGKIYIDAGTIVGDHGHNVTARSFGSPSEVHVANGARWTIDNKYLPAGLAAWDGQNSATQSSQPCTPLSKTKVFVSGDGTDGTGAIYYNGGKNNHNLFGPVTLEGDTTFYVKKRWGIGGAASPLNANGHDIIIKGNDQFEIGRSKTFKISNPGDIRLVSGSVLFESGSTSAAEGSEPLSNKTVYVASGKGVYVFNYDLPYRLHYQGQGTSTLTLGYNSRASLPCAITGEGGTLKIATGATITQALNLKILSGITGLDVVVSSGALDVNNAPIVFEGAATNVIGRLSTENGTTVFRNGSTNVIGSICATSMRESLRFEDAGLIVITNKSVGETWNAAVPITTKAGIRIAEIASGEKGNITRMTVSGKTVITSAHPVESGKLAPLCVAIAVGNSQNQYPRGILDVRNGAIMTNDFFVGQYTTSVGAIYLSGDDTQIVSPGSNTSMTWFGRANSYAAFEMKGGTFESGGYLTIGQGGRGFMMQRGGLIKVGPSCLKIGRENNCYAHYCVLGGEFRQNGNVEVRLGFCDAYSGASGHTAVFTVGGGSGVSVASASYVLGYLATNINATARGISMVNINKGGTLNCSRMYRNVSGNWAAAYPTGNSISPMYVNFNGGTLVTSANTSAFFNNDSDDSDAAERQPTRVTVFGDGATVDTDGHNVGMTCAFEKPYGKGIKSVQLTDAESLTANRSVGTRRVVISGAGAAADVITDFDLDTRSNAAQAIVTSPGFGYDQADTTAKVEAYKIYTVLSNASITAWHDFDSPDYKHGGFTKKGAGTLTLKGANTYGGATRVEAGTLAFANESGYPGGDLEFPASAVTNAAAPLVTAQAMTFKEGAKIRVTGADDLNPDCCLGFRSVVTCAQAFTALPAIEWVDDDGEQVVVPAAWNFRLGNGGKSIEFGYSRGTVLILR